MCTLCYQFRATGGELFRLIAKDPLSEEKSREVVYQILDGVRHLHSLNIVHLDLKVSVYLRAVSYTHLTLPTIYSV